MSRWDTAGQEAYEEARRVCYSGTDVLLIGFSIVEPDSLANVENLWAKEANLETLRDAPVGQRVNHFRFQISISNFLRNEIRYKHLVQCFPCTCLIKN